MMSNHSNAHCCQCIMMAHLLGFPRSFRGHLIIIARSYVLVYFAYLVHHFVHPYTSHLSQLPIDGSPLTHDWLENRLKEVVTERARIISEKKAASSKLAKHKVRGCFWSLCHAARPPPPPPQESVLSDLEKLKTYNKTHRKLMVEVWPHLTSLARVRCVCVHGGGMERWSGMWNCIMCTNVCVCVCVCVRVCVVCVCEYTVDYFMCPWCVIQMFMNHSWKTFHLLDSSIPVQEPSLVSRTSLGRRPRHSCRLPRR